MDSVLGCGVPGVCRAVPGGSRYMALYSAMWLESLCAGLARFPSVEVIATSECKAMGEIDMFNR